MLAVCLSSSVKESISDGQTSSFERVCKFVPKKCESSLGQGNLFEFRLSLFFTKFNTLL